MSIHFHGNPLRKGVGGYDGKRHRKRDKKRQSIRCLSQVFRGREVKLLIESWRINNRMQQIDHGSMWLAAIIIDDVFFPGMEVAVASDAHRSDMVPAVYFVFPAKSVAVGRQGADGSFSDVESSGIIPT
ncbi:hypothetical protein ACQKLP_25675 [Chitinophaga sp. NPDC101104]|uniref:hypothetical protein n=1 Tax=Chitinophaga sp. NPDC101104 TaxID=3390561 RepID=UPI003D01DDE3